MNNGQKHLIALVLCAAPVAAQDIYPVGTGRYVFIPQKTECLNKVIITYGNLIDLNDTTVAHCEYSISQKPNPAAGWTITVSRCEKFNKVENLGPKNNDLMMYETAKPYDNCGHKEGFWKLDARTGDLRYCTNRYLGPAPAPGPRENTYYCTKIN
jgi:hypothetical protein